MRRPFTAEEQAWIRSLTRVLKRMPPTLMTFSNGSMNVGLLTEDGKAPMRSGGSVDSSQFEGIEGGGYHEGGGW